MKPLTRGAGSENARVVSNDFTGAMVLRPTAADFRSVRRDTWVWERARVVTLVLLKDFSEPWRRDRQTFGTTSQIVSSCGSGSSANTTDCLSVTDDCTTRAEADLESVHDAKGKEWIIARRLKRSGFDPSIRLNDLREENPLRSPSHFPRHPES